jgi:hypothetical protein
MEALGIYARFDMTDGSANRPAPLMAFVHVPKTAGSTINSILSQRLRFGVEHCEKIVDDPKALGKGIGRLQWISGHVNYTHLSQRLKAVTDRSIHFYSIMRNPTQQVMSHYNWLIEIFHRDAKFYDQHPDDIKQLSERIRKTDHSNPEAIAALLRDYAGLFLNVQSATILGSNFNWNSGLIMRRLSLYRFVGTERDVPQLIEIMTGKPAKLVRRRNVSPYHFDKGVFEEPHLRNFLMRRNFLDWSLYEAINNAKTRVAASSSFRRQRIDSDVKERHDNRDLVDGVQL